MERVRNIEIETERDIVLCRRVSREMARELGFNLVDQTRITTTASELARNIYEYAKSGEVAFEVVNSESGLTGLQMVYKDTGPGIENLSSALDEGWTSHRGMGLGLPGSKKLMDEFSIESEVGVGTTVTVVKWLR
jgi:serine/threonine-protein kinase RsbT